MKKSLSNLFLIFFILVFSLTNTGVSFADTQLKGAVNIDSSAPKWEEFCPPKYLNIVDAKKPNLLVDTLLSVSIVFLPLSLAHTNEYGYQVYWVERRKQFDSEINACLAADKKNMESCFTNVRNMEQIKAASWIDLQQQLTSATSQILLNTANCIQAQAQGLQSQQINNYNSYSNYNSAQNAINSTNNAQTQKTLHVKTCTNQCESARMTCRNGVQSAPTFGNDISASRNAHLAQCDLNYANCVNRCSY